MIQLQQLSTHTQSSLLSKTAYSLPLHHSHQLQAGWREIPGITSFRLEVFQCVSPTYKDTLKHKHTNIIVPMKINRHFLTPVIWSVLQFPQLSYVFLQFVWIRMQTVYTLQLVDIFHKSLLTSRSPIHLCLSLFFFLIGVKCFTMLC